MGKNTLEQNVTALKARVEEAEAALQNAETNRHDDGIEDPVVRQLFAKFYALAKATKELNRISSTVANVFHKKLDELQNLQMHTCGLIGLNVVEGEDRDGLLRGMEGTIREIMRDAGMRMETVQERDRSNVQETQKVVRQVNDTRAAVQTSRTQEMDFAPEERGGHER